VVDDDPTVVEVLTRYLDREGFEVRSAADGSAAVEAATQDLPDLIVLDLMLPEMSGLDVFRRIRLMGRVPVIMLTALGEEEDRVGGLEVGADDYVTKPFSMAELEARLRTALRHARVSEEGPTEVHFGRLSLDLARTTATLDGKALDLTSHEFGLLAFLAQNGGKVCTNEMILKHVWGSNYRAETNYVRSYVHRLRRKLGDERSELLRNHPGIGYELVAP
jgi:DNA-binding response OmpR family regulator